MFSKAARAVIAGRWLFVVFWILLAAGLSQVAPNLQEEVNTSQQTARAKSDAEAIEASRLLAEKFPAVQRVINNQVSITFFRPSGLTDEDRAYGRSLEQFLVGHKDDIRLESTVSPFSDTPQSADLLSADKQAALLNLNLDTEYASQDSNKWLAQIKDVIPKIRAYLSTNAGDRGGAPAPPAGLELHLTGGNALQEDIYTLQEASLARTLVMTLAFILVVLLIVYRSPVAAIFPIIAVVLALTVSQGVLGFVARAGLSVSPNALVFLIIVLFGLGTDHSLLIVSRFRENLLAGREKRDALRNAVGNGGEAIFASICTVFVAFGCMLFAKDLNFRGIGPPLAIAVVIEFLVIMTLIPAFIAILGEKIFWPFLPSKQRARRSVQPSGDAPTKSRHWVRIAAAVTSRPNRFIVIPLVALLPFLCLLIGFHYDNNELRALLPTATDSYKGLTVVRQHFGQAAGADNSVVVLIRSDQNILDGTTLRTVETVSGKLDGLAGVSKVVTATRPTGEALTPELLSQLTGSAAPSGAGNVSIFVAPGDPLQRYPQARALAQQYVSSDGTTVVLNLTLSQDPHSEASLNTITDIRGVLHESLKGTPLAGASTLVGGETAEVRDNLERQRRDFVLIIIVVLTGIFVVLMLLLRSLVMPVYMVATIVLAFAATMGFTYATFTYGFGDDGLWFDTPVVAFVILVALGIDYSIFLMTRVKEEHYTHGKPTRVAVGDALSSTGAVITSCGIILAGTFIPLVFSGIKTYVEMGVAIVFGLLLDTFVIRTLLVPAVAVRVGDANWWPRRRQPEVAGTPAPPEDVMPDVHTDVEEISP